jgi:hypothetical protein
MEEANLLQEEADALQIEKQALKLIPQYPKQMFGDEVPESEPREIPDLNEEF